MIPSRTYRAMALPCMACVAAWLTLGLPASHARTGRSNPTGLNSDSPLYCFIIRTYFRHGGAGRDNQLRTLLKDLVAQSGSPSAHRWKALLVVVDSVPFEDLRKIIAGFEDPRIQVHAEMIGPEFNPKTGGQWTQGYHQKLYHITDEAISACPKSTEWVIATNGDNRYDSKFTSEFYSVPDTHDVVAFDFYSRYQRPTANPCERWAANPGYPNCKTNEMRFCNTDLAANGFRWRRFVKEQRKFGTLDPQGVSSAEDGIMASVLRRDGWQVYHVEGGKCLVAHMPNAQMCALSGGVWDDAVMIDASSFGGECISHAQAERKLKAESEMYELIRVPVSHDPDSFGIGVAFPERSTFQLSCLRPKWPAWWRQGPVFGKVCCAAEDWKDCINFGPHPWDNWLPAELAAQRTAALAVNEEL